jgi:hypothetical protein
MDTATMSGLRARLPDLRLALSLIGGFWLFYFATILIRMVLLEEGFHYLAPRALGCIVGTFLTFLLYLVLSRAAGETIRVKVIAAALACLPAAAIFSTFNLAFYLQQPLASRTVVIDRRGDTPKHDVPGEIRIERRGPIVIPVSAAKKRGDIPRLIADGLVTWYFFFGAWAALYLALSSAGQLRSAERRAARA